MTAIAVVDNNGNNFMYTNCGIPEGFRQATEDEINTYQVQQNSTINIINEINILVSNCTPWQKYLYQPVLQRIINDVNAGNWADLTALANDSSIPADLQSVQAKLKALIPVKTQ